MQRTKKLSNSAQRKRLMHRHKLKVNGRRLNHFMQESQDAPSHVSSVS